MLYSPTILCKLEVLGPLAFLVRLYQRSKRKLFVGKSLSLPLLTNFLSTPLCTTSTVVAAERRNLVNLANSDSWKKTFQCCLLIIAYFSPFSTVAYCFEFVCDRRTPPPLSTPQNRKNNLRKPTTL